MDVVTPDYYATLGVAPSSEDVVIRAAYLALMRRYHPDMNASAEAAARVRAITAAYAVLSDWDRRAEYDLLRAEGAAEYARPRRPKPSPTALFAAAAFALLLMVVIWPTLPQSAPPVRAAVEQDTRAAAPKPDLAALCASPPTYERIKRELFRRAARLRGRDQAAFDRIAGFSLIRADSPELAASNEVLGTIRCRATIAVDLPPGVAVLGGRRTLTAQIDYSLEADGNGAIGLSNEGLIAAPLATLAQVRRPPDVPDSVEPPPAPPPVRVTAPPPVQVTPVRAAPVRTVPPRTAPPRPAPIPPRGRTAAAAGPPRAQPEPSATAAKPSFSCRYAKGRGENAVCANANLARLDRHLAVFYAQSWGQADAARREKLLGTRERFIARRDACRSDACVNGAYVRRMREVSDIMATKN